MKFPTMNVFLYCPLKAGLLSLAGDALCLAVTALRLSEPTPRVPVQQEKNSNPPIISMDQVSWHDHCSDCWIVIYDRVYDVTDFLLEVSVVARQPNSCQNLSA
jgi:hypothetical protein